MFVDWYNIDRSARIVDAVFFVPFYQTLSGIAREYSVFSWTAPVIGFVDGMASVVQVVCGVSEAAIKGIGNLFRQGESKRGALQLLFGVGFVSSLAIPVIFIRVLRVMKGIATQPLITCHAQVAMYQNKRKTFELA